MKASNNAQTHRETNITSGSYNSTPTSKNKNIIRNTSELHKNLNESGKTIKKWKSQNNFNKNIYLSHQQHEEYTYPFLSNELVELVESELNSLQRKEEQEKKKEDKYLKLITNLKAGEITEEQKSALNFCKRIKPKRTNTKQKDIIKKARSALYEQETTINRKEFEEGKRVTPPKARETFLENLKILQTLEEGAKATKAQTTALSACNKYLYFHFYERTPDEPQIIRTATNIINHFKSKQKNQL